MLQFSISHVRTTSNSQDRTASRTAGTGEPRQDTYDRASRTKQLRQENLDRKARTDGRRIPLGVYRQDKGGQDGLNIKTRTGKLGRDKWGRTTIAE